MELRPDDGPQLLAYSGVYHFQVIAMTSPRTWRPITRYLSASIMTRLAVRT